MLAPIVLFVYNRPWHTRKTLESLAVNNLSDESELFIFADGPKENASSEQIEKIIETRKIIRERKWCYKVNIIEREHNGGLANSVITGVTEIVNKFEKIIVLEDDLILSGNFLKYMNDALDRFKNEERVMQISGYSYPLNISYKNDAFFLPFISSWGWATWKRSWKYFSEDLSGADIFKKNKELRKKFDLNNSYPFFHMLESKIKKRIDSWAISFYFNVFMNDGLVLYPIKSMVVNCGMDKSGTNCKFNCKQEIIDDNFEVKKFPEVETNPQIVSSVFLFKKMNPIKKSIIKIFKL